MRPLRSTLLTLLILSVACAGAPPGRGGDSEVAAASPSRGHLAGRLDLELFADFNIPAGSSPEALGGAVIGGLSGLFFDPETMELVAISDARGDRLYFTLRVDLDADEISVTPSGLTRLADVEPVPEVGESSPPSDVPRIIDLEGIARARGGNLFVSAEGRVARQPRVPPAIAEYRPDGSFMRLLPVPEKFLPEIDGPQTRGVAENLAFESLTASPDGSRLFAAAESALMQDDSEADFDKGSLTRIIVFELGAEEEGVSEYVYPIEPVTRPNDFEPRSGINGLVELLALSRNELLALERSFVTGGAAGAPIRANAIRIFHISLEGATDVAGIPSLRDQPGAVPVSKELVLDLEDIVPQLSPEFPTLDNFEGMSFGPVLPDGSPSLILVSDDNFNPWQRTAFLFFRLKE